MIEEGMNIVEGGCYWPNYDPKPSPPLPQQSSDLPQRTRLWPVVAIGVLVTIVVVVIVVLVAVSMAGQ